MRRWTMVAACVLLSACGSDDGPTVIDGGSQAAFDGTLAAAKGDLGPRDRLKLEAALAEYRSRVFAKADNRQEFNRLYRQGLDGLTTPAIAAQFDKDVDRVGGKAADAVFDAKRVLSGR